MSANIGGQGHEAPSSKVKVGRHRPTIIYKENKWAIRNVNRQDSSMRSRCVNVTDHFTREHRKMEAVQLLHIESKGKLPGFL